MPKGIRKIAFSFEDQGLTHFGGMAIFQQFCQKLQLKRLLQTYVLWNRRSNLYHPVELLLSMIYTMVAGMGRIFDTRIIQYNGCFQELLGLRAFPNYSTLREFLKGISSLELEGIIRVHDLLRKKVWSMSHHPLSSLIFDLDSTILPVFGWKIEQARVGYNPKKPGRPSYHPLICFEAHTRDCWCGILRPGNAHPVTGAQVLWATVQRKIPRYLYRIRIRADSGFFDHKFIEPLDEEGLKYVVVAKMTKPIQRKVQHLRYHTFRKTGWQVAQFSYRPWNWKKPHRFIVVRRPKPQREEKEPQLSLWEFKDYFYHAFVSNIALKPESIWHFYKPRARCELDIRELKESFPLGKIPTNSFLANQVHFHLTLLAYDLTNWFKRLCLPQKWNSATLHTLRRELLALPARLVHTGGRNQLKLPQRYPHQKLFYRTFERIDHLKIH